ncbi:MAG: SUMF1/EgtB/PvdO family nonheme iron enzyme [Deltaproteobacteria bacterium]|nr:SUMF1/EgtB/PvdO family nonheme iron enzyme [Deltaproteobacteria bacterium]
MGEVHLAEDKLLARPVAIKFISAANIEDEDRLRFMNEARAIARLQHPNVVSVYKVGEVERIPYLVSEFVRGKPLDSIPIPVTQDHAIKIGNDIACGLAAAHRRGVVHRDIKPANAILADSGEVKLLDFGIAKLQPHGSGTGPFSLAPLLDGNDNSESQRATTMGHEVEETAQFDMFDTSDALQVLANTMSEPGQQSITDSGVILGTPSYIAPEIWRGEPATFRCDIYSFGVLMYALLTGHPPLNAPNLKQLFYKVQNEDIPPLKEAVPHISASFAEIIDKCLKRDPAVRYSSGNELRSALSALTSEGRADVVPKGNPYRGLHAFESEHQNLFFGRDSEIRMVLERLNVESFVLIAGDSGVGKSSLCRAGILPRVNKWLGKNRDWKIETIIPGKHPVSSFSAALCPIVGQSEQDLARLMMESPSEVGRKIRAGQGNHAGLVIFIDQFEELVTFSDPSESGAIAEVLGWLAAPTPGLRLLATVRGDFLSRLAVLPHFGEEISKALYFLRPLSSERIREAVEGPARVMDVSFESLELVDTLVESTEQAEGGLPLLQFALAELWEAREPGKQIISQASLEAVGGVEGALTRHADNVIDQIAQGERVHAKQILLNLVSSDGTRTRRTHAELAIDTPGRKSALDALVRGRLLVARDTPEGAGYEIAHEVLIRGWSTLAGWLTADAESRLIRERLRRAVSEWERLGRRKETLWSSKQLAEAKGLSLGELPPKEKTFLHASSVAVRRARFIKLGLIVALPVIIGIVYGAVILRSENELQKRIDKALQKAVGLLTDARKSNLEIDDLRVHAFSLFDAKEKKEAEVVWEKYLSRTSSLGPFYGQVSQHLETALLMDRERTDVLELFADVLFERAEFAEKQGRKKEVNEHLQRLKLYDVEGRRMTRWNARAKVSIVVSLGDAKIELHRYIRNEQDRYTEKTVPIQNPSHSEIELQQGAYILFAKADGRVPIRLTFLLSRGENKKIELTMPRAAKAPNGYVYIPPGETLFGSSAENTARRDFFKTVPIHKVSTPGFLIARHETTFEDWIAYLMAFPEKERLKRAPKMDKGGFQGLLNLSMHDEKWEISFQLASMEAFTASEGQKVIYKGRSHRRKQDWLKFPVFGISTADAEQYVRWLDRSGKVPRARLCNEYEWERAARGSDGRKFPHGESLAPDDANFDNTYGKDSSSMGPDEVGSHPKSRSPYGLLDMAGNVWEWTTSSVSKDGYAARGGSYLFGALTARTTQREVTEPTFKDVSVGMRVCADLE